jgi:hypothetical protein
VERYEAHRILTQHLPVRDGRWLWLRHRCRRCAAAYPCLFREGALLELAGGAGAPPNTAPWLRLINRPGDNRGRRW